MFHLEVKFCEVMAGFVTYERADPNPTDDRRLGLDTDHNPQDLPHPPRTRLPLAQPKRERGSTPSVLEYTQAISTLMRSWPQTEPRTSLSGCTGFVVRKFATPGGVIFSRRFRCVLAVVSWRQRCSRVPCHPCPLRATSSCPCPVGIEPSGQPAAGRGACRPWDESGT